MDWLVLVGYILTAIVRSHQTTSRIAFRLRAFFVSIWSMVVSAGFSIWEIHRPQSTAWSTVLCRIVGVTLDSGAPKDPDTKVEHRTLSITPVQTLFPHPRPGLPRRAAACGCGGVQSRQCVELNVKR